MFSLLSKSALSLLLLAGASVAPTALADSPRILDLSQDFPVGDLNNQDAIFFEQFLTRDIRRFIVLDDGEVVMNYQRDSVRDDDVYNLWSASKAIMSFFVGTVLFSDQYNLTMNTTLGEIFVGENDWSEVTDPEELAFKKNVTIYEMLTMTSGLTTSIDLTEVISPNPFNPIDVANGAGINLRQSLAHPGVNATLKGTVNYMPVSNVLSYVIKAVTGMTPMEYISIDILPSLGISPDEIGWDANFAGVQTSFSNMKFTGLQMAKFAQLYLQMGKSSPDKQLIPAEFVEDSLQPWLYTEQFQTDYGYLWLYRPFNTTADPTFPDGGLWCGAGLMGQMLCLNYDTNRVAVLQRSNTVWDIENWFTSAFALLPAAFSSNYTWNVTANVTTVEGQPSSGALSLSVWGALSTVAFSFLASSWL
mmetsp:Transcript_8035/g.19767  ORF Transcript_8035/g.19767 Transcript_8035/m.19767 type:complete len:418 (-) Transcript_8035:271-1524(-)